MQTVSSTYTTILSGKHRAEWKVAIAGVDYGEDVLQSIEINRSVFASSPVLGSCISAEIDVALIKPTADIPRMALIEPYVRITNGTLTSEWLPKGKFYIDTREFTKNDAVDVMKLHGFDAMLMAEQLCPIENFPMTDIQAVNAIATFLGFTVDSGASSQIVNSYQVPIPAQYSCREVLGYIAAMYAGCWIMDDFGHLRLVTVNGMPAETNYLINTAGLVITFGGDRIIV